MIQNRFTSYIIKDIEQVKNMKLHEVKSLHPLSSRDWIFSIPENIKENQHKLIYKVGFLTDILSFLNQEQKKIDIYRVISSEWQVFKSIRQLERLYSQYQKLFVKKEER